MPGRTCCECANTPSAHTHTAAATTERLFISPSTRPVTNPVPRISVSIRAFRVSPPVRDPILFIIKITLLRSPNRFAPSPLKAHELLASAHSSTVLVGFVSHPSISCNRQPSLINSNNLERINTLPIRINTNARAENSRGPTSTCYISSATNTLPTNVVIDVDESQTDMRVKEVSHSGLFTQNRSSTNHFERNSSDEAMRAKDVILFRVVRRSLQLPLQRRMNIHVRNGPESSATGFESTLTHIREAYTDDLRSGDLQLSDGVYC